MPLASTTSVSTRSLSLLVALVAIAVAIVKFSGWPRAPSPLRKQEAYRRISLPEDAGQDNFDPDTTAVILNWSRFPNVLRISSVLCSESLNGVVAQVFVWNNNPSPISYDDFLGTGCPRSKLRIYNSPENTYFQARFIACSQSNTQYCFIQDDDYLVTEEVVYALHARIRDAKRPHTIHLLPPHEHLSSTLREIHVDGPVPVHTSFAWLGHGTILHRSEATAFLALMRLLNASESEMKMADNYYTVLSNRMPEIWLDQGIELGGGQPFTVGTEGDDRNKRHILRAAEYLETLVAGRSALGTEVPYVWLEGTAPDPQSTTLAVCRTSGCVFETNIPTLPDGLRRTCSNPGCMLEVEIQNRDFLGGGAAARYVDRAPSRAVDDRAETYFESYHDARAGEYVLLDQLAAGRSRRASGGRMVLLIDRSTARILAASALEASCDRTNWLPLEHTRICREAENGLPRTSGPEQTDTLECVLEWSPLLDGPTAEEADVGRFVRLRVLEDVASRWRIYEVYLTAN